MNIEIFKNPLTGAVDSVPSKSVAHRAIICALLSKSVCEISPIDMSDDMKATINAAVAFGAEYKYHNRVLVIDSRNAFNASVAKIDCYESGSTMRFITAVAATMGITTEFIGHGRLPERPMTDFYDLFKSHGAVLSSDHLPLTSSGKLKPGVYEIGGNVSSQYITGLLLALATLDGDSEIVLTTPLQSEGYVDITIDVQRKFGVIIDKTGKGYRIKGGQQYCADKFNVEGDWSQAAFFLCAGAVCGDLKVNNLYLDSLQGDREIFNILRRMGADIAEEADGIRCKKSTLAGAELDVSQVPDLVPAIAMAAAFANTKTRIYNAERLRIKESDRIKSTCAALESFGCKTEEFSDGFYIMPSELHSGTVDCANDHRIAMAYSMMSSRLGGRINGCECVKKSYPDFYADFEKIGGKYSVIDR